MKEERYTINVQRVGRIWWLDGIKVLGDIYSPPSPHQVKQFIQGSLSMTTRNLCLLGVATSLTAHKEYISYDIGVRQYVLPRMECHLISVYQSLSPPPVITHSSKEQVKMGIVFFDVNAWYSALCNVVRPFLTLDLLKSRQCSLCLSTCLLLIVLSGIQCNKSSTLFCRASCAKCERGQ